MGTGRVTKKEKLARDAELQKRLLEGASETQIVRDYSAKWKCSDTNVRKYLYQIIEQWKQAQLDEAPTLRNKYLARLELMFKETWAEGNRKTALDIQKEINKICGLHNDTGDDNGHAPIITISSRRADVISEHKAISAPQGSTDGNTDEGS